MGRASRPVTVTISLSEFTAEHHSMQYAESLHKAHRPSLPKRSRESRRRPDMGPSSEDGKMRTQSQVAPRPAQKHREVYVNITRQRGNMETQPGSVWFGVFLDIQ